MPALHPKWLNIIYSVIEYWSKWKMLHKPSELCTVEFMIISMLLVPQICIVFYEYFIIFCVVFNRTSSDGNVPKENVLVFFFNCKQFGQPLLLGHFTFSVKVWLAQHLFFSSDFAKHILLFLVIVKVITYAAGEQTAFANWQHGIIRTLKPFCGHFWKQRSEIHLFPAA